MSGESFEVDAESWCKMTDELDQLRAERVVVNNTIFALTSENVGLSAENSRLSAEVERMRGVLEAVEWEGYCIGDKACPDCNGLWLHDEHKPDCPLGCALGRPECVSSADGGEARE